MNGLAWSPPIAATPPRDVTLTPRQADVLTGLCLGFTNEQIARRLELSENTIKTHVARLLRAMGARDRCHAAVLAISGQATVTVEMGYVGR